MARMIIVVYVCNFAVQEIFAGWTCPASVLVAAVTSVLKSVVSQPEGIAQMVLFDDTVVRFLKSTIHTFQIRSVPRRPSILSE